jgi:hypothetical protein
MYSVTVSLSNYLFEGIGGGQAQREANIKDRKGELARAIKAAVRESIGVEARVSFKEIQSNVIKVALKGFNIEASQAEALISKVGLAIRFYNGLKPRHTICLTMKCELSSQM